MDKIREKRAEWKVIREWKVKKREKIIAFVAYANDYMFGFDETPRKRLSEYNFNKT